MERDKVAAAIFKASIEHIKTVAGYDNKDAMLFCLAFVVGELTIEGHKGQAAKLDEFGENLAKYFDE